MNDGFDELESVILAALFTSQDPLTINEIYRVINDKYVLKKGMKKISKKGIEGILEKINTKLNNLGLPWLIEKKPNNSYDLIIKDEIFMYVEKLAPVRDFSRATLQTLALIAYRSPIEQKEVVRIRGQRAYKQIKELLERDFIKSERYKHTNILRISKKFLDYFGLKSEDELKEFFGKHYIENEDFNENENKNQVLSP